MLGENRGALAHPAHMAETSFWPIVLAATLSIACIGFLIHPIVSIVGAALSAGAIVAWGLQRFAAPGSEAEEHGPRERVTVPALDVGEAGAETGLEVVRSPAWWGMVWFIATEATFFAFLIASYVYLRVNAPTWPPEGIPHRDLVFPSVNTVILLLSGVPAYFGHRAIRKGDRRGLAIGLLLSALLGAIFLGGQFYEYAISELDARSNALAAGFYVLTGFHGLHVLAGVAILVIMAAISSRFTHRHHFGVEFASTYWHFVDLVWIFLFTLLYLLQ